MSENAVSGTDQHRREIPNANCPHCDDDLVAESPEAGYAICLNCGERGYRNGDGVDWWQNDPDSQWYVEPDSDPDGGGA